MQEEEGGGGRKGVGGEEPRGSLRPTVATRWPTHWNARSRAPAHLAVPLPQAILPLLPAENAPPDPAPRRQPEETSLPLFSLQWLILGGEEISLLRSRCLPLLSLQPHPFLEKG